MKRETKSNYNIRVPPWEVPRVLAVARDECGGGVGVVGTGEVQGEYREGARRAGGIGDT